MNTDLRYPIGKFPRPEEITAENREAWIADLAALPSLLADAVRGLSQEQLDTPYRDGGWTVRQVVHHVADSHMNCLMRFKLALTEDNPAIKPYFEDRWAQLGDSIDAPIEPSLQLIEGLHKRWVQLIRSMSEAEFGRTFFHPESKREYKLDFTLGLYAWHSRHHVAHITSLRERMGW